MAAISTGTTYIYGIAGTVATIADELDCSRSDVMNSRIRFALCNRDWVKTGLYSPPKTEARATPIRRSNVVSFSGAQLALDV